MDVRTTAGSFNATEPASKPRFTKPERMHMQIVRALGHPLRLKCPAVGNPMPNITWTKNRHVPERSSALSAVQYRQWSIIIDGVVASDSGNYTCHVCNSKGCVEFTYFVEIGKFFHIETKNPIMMNIKAFLIFLDLSLRWS